jgi:hypothetical protein
LRADAIAANSASSRRAFCKPYEQTNAESSLRQPSWKFPLSIVALGCDGPERDLH